MSLSAEQQAAFSARVVRPESGGLPALVQANRDLIIELHHANLTRSEIGSVMGTAKVGHLFSAFHACKLARRHLGLEGLNSLRTQRRSLPSVRLWTPFEDHHVRRGQISGVLAHSAGAICGRSGKDMMDRARELGLGDWVVEQDPLRRVAAQREFDAAHPEPSGTLSEYRVAM